MTLCLWLAADFAAATTLLASQLVVDSGSFRNGQTGVSWNASAVYLNDAGELGTGVPMTGSGALWSAGFPVQEVSGSTYSGSWSDGGEFDASPGGQCYISSVAASTFDKHAEKVSDDVTCVPQQEPYRDPPGAITICDDGSYTGNCSPIVINLDAGAYALSGADDPVMFDIDGDGSPNRITWTQRRTQMAFLALDRNANALIDDGTELFGTATRLASGVRAGNGFEALQEFDSNFDAAVNALDVSWSALLLWIDANHDGISQPDEVRGIAGSEVQSLSTTYHWTGRRDSHGNFFRYQGLVHITGVRRPYYDIFFRSVQ